MESATHHPQSPTWSRPRLQDRIRSLPLPRPELAAHSMSGSWHNFLFGSFDANGLMTVDKPPMALWVQALSVKAFGFNSLAILVPQALMGVAGVGLLYDLTRRRWGRQAGTVAGLVLALTPIAVAVSRRSPRRAPKSRRASTNPPRANPKRARPHPARPAPPKPSTTARAVRSIGGRISLRQ